MYDYIIIGAGFFGCVCAHELNKRGKKVLVIERRSHIGGNCYSENRDGIDIHMYGPHIFHTSDEEVWNYIRQFTNFNNFIYSPLAYYKEKLYSLPFNMWTFYQMWGVINQNDAKRIIKDQSRYIGEPSNLEEQAIKLVGTDIYNTLIKGYTEKQWHKSAKELPVEIIKRLPVRFTFDNNYFNDVYQGIPVDGYTKIFEKLLNGIEVRLNTDFFSTDVPKHNKLIFTGPIDEYFNYVYGQLEYKTVEFVHYSIDMPNYQSTAVINYTDAVVPYTRIIEHKHFSKSNYSNITWISKETPIPYILKKTDPYYPVNDLTNINLYNRYKKLNTRFDVLFGGRLGEYKYYNMDEIIKSALNFTRKICVD